MIAQFAKLITAFYDNPTRIDGAMNFIVPIKTNVRRHLKKHWADCHCYHYETVKGYWNGSTFEAIDWLNDKAIIAASRKETKRLDAIRDANRAKVRAYRNYIMFAVR